MARRFLPGAAAALCFAGALLAFDFTVAAAPEGRTSTVAEPVSHLAFTRLYTTPDGVSHFSKDTLSLAPIPGAQGMEGTLAVSRIGDVKGVVFARLKAGATEDWHVAPRRQFMVCVHGIVEITASDGEKRRLTPGQFMLLEDTSGKGHVTHAVGTEDHVALAVPVPDGVLVRK
jgi:hypothetical protein